MFLTQPCRDWTSLLGFLMVLGARRVRLHRPLCQCRLLSALSVFVLTHQAVSMRMLICLQLYTYVSRLSRTQCLCKSMRLRSMPTPCSGISSARISRQRSFWNWRPDHVGPKSTGLLSPLGVRFWVVVDTPRATDRDGVVFKPCAHMLTCTWAGNLKAVHLLLGQQFDLCCRVCGRSISLRVHGSTHPSCWKYCQRGMQGGIISAMMSQSEDEAWPSLEDISSPMCEPKTISLKLLSLWLKPNTRSSWLQFWPAIVLMRGTLYL